MSDPMEQIRQMMAAKGITQRELAKRLGRSPSGIAQLLKSRNPQWKTVRRAAEVMGFSAKVEFTQA